MRPSEVNYSSRVKHYIDLSNGEILAGNRERKQYLRDGADPEQVEGLGEVLRDPQDKIDQLRVERANTSEWTKERYIEYGHWLLETVAPSLYPREKHLNSKVLVTASYLGLGASDNAIKSTFGARSKFYVAIGAEDSHIVGEFKDWTLEDYVHDIKQVGGGRRPTANEVTQRGKQNLAKPKGEYISSKLEHIGGFSGLLGLAGYQVIKLWDNDDYVDWGVKFMEANGGIILTARMADYLSTQRLGPSASSLVNKFDKIGHFQGRVIRAYEAKTREAKQVQEDKLAIISSDLRVGKIPVSLFLPKGKAKPGPETEGAIGLECVFASAQQALGDEELMRRYAKYRTLELAIPSLKPDVRLQIARGKGANQDFLEAVGRHSNVGPGEIEHTALVLGFFDNIWPMNSHLDELKLDAGYEEYYKRVTKAKTLKGNNKKIIESLSAATV